MIEALALIELGQATPEEQDESAATYAPKLDARVGARGLLALGARRRPRTSARTTPSPGAWGSLNGAEVKLFGARLAPRGSGREPGEVIGIDADGMLVACGEGAVRILAVQPSGKRRLSPMDWANGRGVAVGDRFDTSAATPA